MFGAHHDKDQIVVGCGSGGGNNGDDDGSDNDGDTDVNNNYKVVTTGRWQLL